MQSIVRTTTAAGRGQLGRAKKLAVPLGNESNVAEPSTLDKGAALPQGILFNGLRGKSSIKNVFPFSSSHHFAQYGQSSAQEFGPRSSSPEWLEPKLADQANELFGQP